MDAHHLSHAAGAGLEVAGDASPWRLALPVLPLPAFELPAVDWSHRHVWYWLPVCCFAGLAFARRRYA